MENICDNFKMYTFYEYISYKCFIYVEYVPSMLNDK